MQLLGIGYNIYSDELNQNNYRIDLGLAIELDEMLLEEAVNLALDIHPNMAVTLEIHDNNLWFVENKRRFEIWHNKTGLLYEETNGYLFGIRAERKNLRLYALHALADGSVMLPFLRTILLEYLDIAHIEDTKSILDERKITFNRNVEIQDPFDSELFSNVAEIENSYVESYKTITGERKHEDKRVISIILSENKLREYMNSWETGRVSTLAAFVSMAIKNMNNPETAIVPEIVVGMSKRLNMAWVSHECYSSVALADNTYLADSIEHNSQMYSLQLEKLIKADSHFQNMVKTRKLVELFRNSRSSIGAKKRMMKRVSRQIRSSRTTYAISCIPFLKSGDELCRYVKSFSNYVTGVTQDIIVESEQVGDVECITVDYPESAQNIVDELIKLFAEYDLLLESNYVDIEIFSLDVERIKNC